MTTQNKTKYFQHNKLAFWFLILGVAIQLVMICTYFYDIITYSIDGMNLWLDFFRYFTTQSNFLITFFVIAYFINPKWKLFSKNYLLVFVTCYITITGLIYNCLLLPSGAPSDAIGWFFSVFRHMIVPLYMIGLYVILIVTKKCNELETKTYKMMTYGMIYPVVYIIYAMVEPFIFWGNSVYGDFTNLNIQTEGGSYFNFLYYALTLILFVGFLFVYWFIIKKTSFKKVNKK